VIKRITETAAQKLGGFDLSALNLPANAYSAMRSIDESEEILCSMADGFPLWFALEKSVIENTPEIATDALKGMDVWKMLTEIYRSFNADSIEEICTLNLKDYFDDKKSAKREEIIEDILADALVRCIEQIRDFLDEWLVKSEG
jgi:hypothetical protein